MNAAANMQEEHSSIRADRSSKQNGVYLKHHVVELNECGCKGHKTNTMSGEQNKVARKPMCIQTTM